jgi:alkylhydroperoxidase family enzyme
VQRRLTRAYSSSMCSNPSGGAGDEGLANRLGSAIDDVAAVANAREQAPDDELTARVAAAWALIAEADPELADRTALYSR